LMRRKKNEPSRRPSRNKNRQPDEVIQAGPTTFAKFGRMIYGFKNQTPDEHNEDLQRFSDALPTIVTQIDGAVTRAADMITSVRPLDLLVRAATEYLVSQIGVEAEVDITREQGLAYRMIDYVQNVIASASQKPEQHKLSDEEWSELKKTVAEIFDVVNLPYQIARSARAQLTDPAYDRHFDEFMFKTQVYWTAVRGDRYLPHAIEQLRTLLSPHDDVLRSLFNVSADALVLGIQVLLESVVAGASKAGDDLLSFRERVIAATVKLVEDGAQGEPEDLMRQVAHSEAYARESADIFDRLFGAGRFDVGRVTGLPDVFLRELAWAPGEESTFFAAGDLRGWPLRVWPLHRRPFLAIEGKYYCFDLYFHDGLYRAIQRLVTRLQPTYAAEWNAKQKEASESLPIELLKQLLAGAQSYRSIFYRFKPAGALKTGWFECDALVTYDDALFIVEVKAGATTYTSPATDFEAHVKSARSLIEQPLIQGRRFAEYVGTQPEVQIFNDRHEEIARLRRSDFRRIIVCAVTLDNLTEVAAQVEHLESFGVNLPPGTVWAFSLDDLRVFRDVLRNPLVFMHYVTQRLRAAASPAIKLDDELDHIGLYLAHGDYRAHAEAIMTGDTPPSFHGYRTEVDKFYYAGMVDPMNETPPASKMPARLYEIIDVLAQQQKRGRTLVSNALLDLTEQGRHLLEGGLALGIDDAKQGITRPISVPSAVPVTLVCSIATRPHNRADLRRHALANSVMLKENERLLLELSFTEDGRLNDVSFEMIRPADLGPDESEKVRRMAERLLDQRMAKAGSLGRNDPCPCGSNKKFKKCHGK
jgi:hypothetical protein